MGFSLAVCTLGSRPVTCNARPLLFQAHAALERGSYIEAGCRLREAVRLYLLADCEYYGVEISKRKVRQTPRALLDAIRKAGHADNFCFEAIGEAIEIGNKAAHLHFVRPDEIEDVISTLHFILDHSPYLLQPMAGGRV